MILKILGLVTSILKAIPHITEAWKKWRYERYQSKLSGSLKEVDSSKSKEELKDAISKASKSLNDN